MAKIWDLRRTGWEEKQCEIFYKWRMCMWDREWEDVCMCVDWQGKKKKHLWALEILHTLPLIFKNKIKKYSCGIWMWQSPQSWKQEHTFRCLLTVNPSLEDKNLWNHKVKSILQRKVFWNSIVKKQKSDRKKTQRKLKEFITIKLVLQEMFKGLF